MEGVGEERRSGEETIPLIICDQTAESEKKKHAQKKMEGKRSIRKERIPLEVGGGTMRTPFARK